MKNNTARGGFTFAEVIVVMGIVMTLFALAYITLFKTQQHLSLTSTAAVIVSEIKTQQAKAMSGNVEGVSDTVSFGIHFESNKYVLFKGTVYNPADTANFPVNLEENLEFSEIKFPDSNIIFIKGSGEILGFVDGLNTITLKSKDLSELTIAVNKLGAASIL